MIMFQQFIGKAFILLFFVAAIFGLNFSAQAQICQPQTSGLVSWYKAENSAADATGQNNGTLRNGATFSAGKTARGFKLDGADDYVEVPDAQSLKPQTLTVEAWVKFDSLTSTTSGGAPGGFQYILNKKNNRQSDHFEAYSLLKLSSHRLAFSIKNDSGPFLTLVDQTQIVAVNRFYHVVGTFDGSTARFYVDGRKVAEAAHAAALSYGNRPIFIGSSGETNWDGKMNGVIDEVRIYNRALTDAEISGNYLAGASLIVNCEAEADQAASGDGSVNHDVTAWENETGAFTIVRYASTSGSFPTTTEPGPQNRGAFFFSGGQAATSSASQIVDLANYAANIDSGTQSFQLSAYLGGFGTQADNARITATFRDAANNPLGSAAIGPVTAAERGGVTGLIPRSTGGIVPVGTRSVEIVLLMTRVDGTFNDGYADNLSFALVQAADIAAAPASWHAGDGDARDFTGVNSGTLINNPQFVVGKVGQAFRFANGSHVQINSSGIFRGQNEGTIEAWIKPSQLPNGLYNASAIWTESESSRNFTRLGLYYLNTGQVGIYANNSQITTLSPAEVPQNAWTHVAGTYKVGEPAKLYVNGVLVAQSSSLGVTLSDDAGAFIGIGALLSAAGDDFDFNGDIDEATAYGRALSAGEIQAIFNAGTAGKLRQAATAAGANVSNLLRDATVTFAQVTTAGETSQTPLETAALPALPAGFSHTGLAYDISTTAAFTGNVDVCFNLPALAGANFSRLRVFHRENGNWVDRTTVNASPQLCAQTASLSPFVIAESLAPTAAPVTISGRITTPNGQGISRAYISLTNASTGETRTAITNPFGFYRFTGVVAGQTYILGGTKKRSANVIPTQVLHVNGDMTNVNFTAFQ
jgi:hypothetical protein